MILYNDGAFALLSYVAGEFSRTKIVITQRCLRMGGKKKFAMINLYLHNEKTIKKIITGFPFSQTAAHILQNWQLYDDDKYFDFEALVRGQRGCKRKGAKNSRCFETHQVERALSSRRGVNFLTNLPCCYIKRDSS